MALGSANSNMGTPSIGYQPATVTALSALETGGLTTGDLAYVPAVNTQAAGYQYWWLDREVAGSVSTDIVAYSKDADSTVGNKGRWKLTNIALA